MKGLVTNMEEGSLFVTLNDWASEEIAPLALALALPWLWAWTRVFVLRYARSHFSLRASENSERNSRHHWMATKKTGSTGVVLVSPCVFHPFAPAPSRDTAYSIPMRSGK